MGRRSRRRGEGPLSTRGVAGEVVGRRRAPVAVRTGGTGGRGERCGELGRLVEVGRGPWGGHGGQLGQSAQLRGAFPFLCFFVFLFQQLLHFLFATIDFAKLCHWPKQSQRIIRRCQKKDCEALEIVCHFHKLKRHLIYFLGHCLK